MGPALLLLALACAPKDLPPYMEPQARMVTAQNASNFSDLSGALAALIGDDPLLRRPVVAPAARYAEIEGGSALAD